MTLTTKQLHIADQGYRHILVAVQLNYFMINLSYSCILHNFYQLFKNAYGFGDSLT